VQAVLLPLLQLLLLLLLHARAGCCFRAAAKLVLLHGHHSSYLPATQQRCDASKGGNTLLDAAV
jgi:hypothetical protein